MAVDAALLKAKVQFDMSELDRGAPAASQKMRQLADDAGTHTGRIGASFGGLKSTIGEGLAIGAGVSGFGLGMQGVKSALESTIGAGVQWQQTLQQIRGNTTMTMAESNSMAGAVKSMAKESGAGLEDLAKGWMHATNLGYGYADAQRIVEAGMKSAITTGGNVSDTVNVLAASMKEWNIPGAQAATVMDTLHMAAAQGNMTLEQLVESGGRAFSTAANLGVGITDVAGAFSAMTRHGFDASTAATNLTGILTHIVNPSKSAQQALAALSKASGIDLVTDFSAAGLKAKGLSGVLDDVRRAVGSDNAEVLKLIPALRGGQGALALTGMGAGDLDEVLKSLHDTMAGKVMPTEAAFSDYQKTVAGQMAIFHANLTVVTTTLSEKFLPGLLALANLGTTGLTWLLGGGLGRAISSLIDPGALAAITSFAHALGTDLLGAARDILPHLQDLSKWLSEHKDVVAGAALGISVLLVPAFIAWGVAAGGAALATIAATAPVLAIAAAAALLGVGILELVRHWGELEAKYPPLQAATNAVEATFHGLADGIVAVWDVIKLAVETGISFVQTTIGDHMTAIHEIFTGVWNAIKGELQLAVDVITGIVKIAGDVLRGDWSGAWKDIKATVTNVWADIKTIVGGEIEALKGVISLGADAIKATLGGAWDWVKTTAETSLGALGGVILAAVNSAIGVLNSFIGAVNSVIEHFPGAGKIPAIALAHFAAGGLVGRTQMAVVGERGPEVVMLPGGSAVLPNSALGRGAGPGDALAALASGGKSLLGLGLDTILGAIPVPKIDTGGIVGDLARGVLGQIKDAAFSFIKDIFDKAKDAVIGRGAGGAAYPGGNAILDMAIKTSGTYLWCEKFVGDVLERLGYPYAPAESALAHSRMQPLQGGMPPVGSVVFYAAGSPFGHVNFAGPAGTSFGTVPEGTGWRGPGAFGPALGWTDRPANGGSAIPGIGQLAAALANAPGTVQDWLLSAIKATGVPASWLGGLSIIAMHESSGDPGAVNRTDVNARAGNPSEGLMQTTLSTFAANALPGHLNILNPVDNTIAAIRYILGRYHDIGNVPGVASMAKGGPYLPYAAGGWITEPVVGSGLRTGQRYVFGEAGPELVTPADDEGMGSSEGFYIIGGRRAKEMIARIVGAEREKGRRSLAAFPGGMLG